MEWKTMWKKIKVIRISRQPSPIQTMVDNPLENVEYFNSLGNRMTNDGRCTQEIKSKVAMAKATFKMKKTLSPANVT